MSGHTPDMRDLGEHLAECPARESDAAACSCGLCGWSESSATHAPDPVALLAANARLRDALERGIFCVNELETHGGGAAYAWLVTWRDDCAREALGPCTHPEIHRSAFAGTPYCVACGAVVP